MLEVRGMRVAAVQLAPVVGDYEANQAAIVDALRVDADLVVLPELATSGYVFDSVEEARSLARPVDEAVGPWIEAAGERVIAGGFAELAGDVVLNSAAIVDRTGVLAVYRKLHLWD